MGDPIQGEGYNLTIQFDPEFVNKHIKPDKQAFSWSPSINNWHQNQEFDSIVHTLVEQTHQYQGMYYTREYRSQLTHRSSSDQLFSDEISEDQSQVDDRDDQTVYDTTVTDSPNTNSLASSSLANDSSTSPSPMIESSEAQSPVHDRAIDKESPIYEQTRTNLFQYNGPEPKTYNNQSFNKQALTQMRSDVYSGLHYEPVARIDSQYNPSNFNRAQAITLTIYDSPINHQQLKDKLRENTNLNELAKAKLNQDQSLYFKRQNPTLGFLYKQWHKIKNLFVPKPKATYNFKPNTEPSSSVTHLIRKFVNKLKYAWHFSKNTFLSLFTFKHLNYIYFEQGQQKAKSSYTDITGQLNQAPNTDKFPSFPESHDNSACGSNDNSQQLDQSFDNKYKQTPTCEQPSMQFNPYKFKKLLLQLGAGSLIFNMMDTLYGLSEWLLI